MPRAPWPGGGSGPASLTGVLLVPLGTVIGRGFSTDPAVVTTAAWTFAVVGVVQWLAGYVFVVDGVLMGAGDTVWLAVAMVVAARGLGAAGAVGERGRDGAAGGPEPSRWPGCGRVRRRVHGAARRRVCGGGSAATAGWSPAPPAEPAYPRLVPLDILVPYWGDPALMRRTVESVLAQTSDDWRLTVVDDAYPDRQVTDWLESMDDPRVRSVRHAENLGITENYRHCLALATHELVVFLGCDDLLLPDYVAVVLAAHRRFPEAAMIQPGVRVVGDDDAPAGEPRRHGQAAAAAAPGGGADLAVGRGARGVAAARELALLAVARVAARGRGGGRVPRRAADHPGLRPRDRPRLPRTAGWSSSPPSASSTGGTRRARRRRR